MSAVDRRKDYPRVPLWIRSSGDRPNGPPPYRPKPYWSPTPEPFERPRRQRPHPEPPKAPRKLQQRSRPPRYEVIATDRITLRSPAHLVDWERRSEIIQDHAELVGKTRESSQAPWPIQVWKIGEEYVLARGFASLAAVVDAGLAEVQVVVAARFPRWELTWVEPKTVQGTDPLLSKAMEAQRKMRTVGWTFPPLTVVSDSVGHYILGRGKRAAARLWAAQTEKLQAIPIVVRPLPPHGLIAGTAQIEVSRVKIVLARHLRKMHKPVPVRLLNEVASGHLRPIRVRRTSDGNYELVDGLLRLRAAQEAGVPTIRAMVQVEFPRE